MASYHFSDDPQTGSYISYSAAPASWTLDDGSKPPAEKYFLGQNYNEGTRTFTGIIDWSETTFHGDAKWNYTMVFSPDFTTIESGQVQCFNLQGDITHNIGFGPG